jgi:uncharacterized protein (TIRG00374 family)
MGGAGRAPARAPRTRQRNRKNRNLKRHLVRLSRALPAVLALALAAWVMRDVDLGHVASRVGGLGWQLPLLLLPPLAVTLIEGFAWWRSFGRLGGRPPFLPLLRVRIATEAMMLGLPSGALISESLQPYLLEKRCGVPLETAVVASVGRKFFVVVSHGLVTVAVTLAAWPMLDAASRATLGRGGLPWALLAAGLFMIGVFGVAILAGVRAQLAGKVRRFLDRLLGRWIGGWLERNAQRFQRTDDELMLFFQQERAALVIPLLLYSFGWLVRGLETVLYLRLLGVSVSALDGTVLESTLILVRSVAVPVPGGLGVQDAGYVLSLKALGVAGAVNVGATLVLLKRGRDLFWILLGFLLLGAGDRSAASAKDGAPAA